LAKGHKNVWFHIHVKGLTVNVNLPHQRNRSVSNSGAAETHLVCRPHTSWLA